MLLLVAAIWQIVIIPSGTNREVHLPATYPTQEECQVDFTSQVRTYVKANGGDARKTRGYCKEINP